MNKDITIYDIAQEAGVSPATVSRVLTKSAGVSKQKKDVVERLIRKYGFRPNAMARSLSDTQTKILGILVADIRNPYYSTLVVECEKAAYSKGYAVMVCNALSDKSLERSNLEKLYEQRVDAIIQIGCSVDEFMSDPVYVSHVNKISRTTPFVITGKLDGADCYRLGIDDVAGMDAIVEYLVSLGHHDIAFVGGKRTVMSTYEKYQRFIYLANKLDLHFGEEYMVEGSYSAESGFRCAQQVLKLENRPTAIIAVNDFSAVGIVSAITQAGLRVPEDISIVSFDNTYLAEMVTPKLTSVDYNYAEFGRRLVETALDAKKGVELSRKMKMAPTLIVRDSCSPPKAIRRASQGK